MTDDAALVTALRAGRTWQRVADLCQYRRKRRHSAGYYQQIATGRIRNPSAETLAGIVRAPALAERLLKSHFSREARWGLCCRRSLGLELSKMKKRHNWTWDQLLEKALDLMRERYG